MSTNSLKFQSLVPILKKKDKLYVWLMRKKNIYEIENVENNIGQLHFYQTYSKKNDINIILKKIFNNSNLPDLEKLKNKYTIKKYYSDDIFSFYGLIVNNENIKDFHPIDKNSKISGWIDIEDVIKLLSYENITKLIKFQIHNILYNLSNSDLKKKILDYLTNTHSRNKYEINCIKNNIFNSKIDKFLYIISKKLTNNVYFDVICHYINNNKKKILSEIPDIPKISNEIKSFINKSENINISDSDSNLSNLSKPYDDSW